MLFRKIAVLLTAVVFAAQPAGALEFKKVSAAETKFSVSKKYQPNYAAPQKYSSDEMQQMAREVLRNLESRSGKKFNRADISDIKRLAEFFGLLNDPKLDKYSTAMTESDIAYFSDIDQYGAKELYPQNDKQLVIRFYWEGLARAAAVHYKLKVVDNKFSSNPRMSRGKVSDMATTAMFDKRPRMTIAEAAAEGKERYDFGRLIKHLHDKGLPG